MEIFGVDAWLFWFLCAVGLLVVELAIAFTFYAGAIAPGCLAASLVAAFDGSTELQLLALIIGALASLLFLRPIVKRHLVPPPPDKSTNVQRLIGRRAVAISEVDVDSGTVRIGDDTWSARTRSESVVIGPGERARVIEVSGVFAYVEPMPPAEENPSE